MGSLQLISENVLKHVPKDRRDAAATALDAMRPLCDWADTGELPRVPSVLLQEQAREVSIALHRALGAQEGANHTVYIETLAASDVPVFDWASFDRLDRALGTGQRGRDDLAEAMPWMLNDALWEKLPAALDRIPQASRSMPAIQLLVVTAVSEITGRYVMAVIRDNSEAVRRLTPVILAMPHALLIGCTSPWTYDRVVTFLGL